MKLNEFTVEELEEGQEFKISKKLQREDIERFCELTNDHHPLHTDLAYALEHGFKDVIAHGALITSYSSALVGMQAPGKNALVLSQSFAYSKPAYPGDDLSIVGTIHSIDKRFNTLVLKVAVRNQEGLKLANGEWKVMIRKQ